MPCNSEYMNPTYKEKQLQETAQLLIYVRQHTNSGKKIDARLKAASKDCYISDNRPERIKVDW